METLFVVLLNGLAFSGLLFLLASGLTLVLGLARVVNFAHGSLYILGGYFFISLFNLTDSWWLALTLASLSLVVVGAIIEVLLLRPIYGKPVLLQLILTFGLVLIFEDAIRIFWGNIPFGLKRPPEFLAGTLQFLGVSFPKNSLATILAAGAIALFLWALLNRTRLGKQLNAASSDTEMATALGMNVPLLYTIAFAIGAFCAGIGGSLLTLKVGLLPSMGLHYLIFAIAVVIIGGMGSYKGSIVGALIVGICYSFSVLFFPDLSMILVFGLLFFTLLIRPRGLYGKVEEIREPDVTVEDAVHFDIGKLLGLNISQGIINWGALALLVVLVILLPMVDSGFWSVFVSEVMILMVLASSLNLLVRSGMLSLAHGAFFGAGAYMASLTLIHYTNSLIASIFAAVMLSSILAMIIGFLSLRHVELYFKLFTLAFAEFFFTIVYKWKKVTGGDDGLMNIPLPSLNFFGLTEDFFTPDTEAKFLYLILIISLACLIFLRKVRNSPFGQILNALRENPERVSFLGININNYKLAVFVIAGAVAGLAGAVFAPLQMVISPMAAHWTKSVDPLFMNIIGGVDPFVGPSVGAIIFTFLKDWLSSLMDYWRIVFGFLLVFVALAFPRGVVIYGLMGVKRILRKKPSEMPDGALNLEKPSKARV